MKAFKNFVSKIDMSPIDMLIAITVAGFVIAVLSLIILITISTIPILFKIGIISAIVFIVGAITLNFILNY